MSGHQPYDPALFLLERRETASSKLGEFVLGVSRLGANTEGAWFPVKAASFAYNCGYTPDENGTLIFDAESATVSLSQWDTLDDPLYPSDRIKASYDGQVLFRGTADSTDTSLTADLEAVRHGATRRVDFGASIVGNYAAMMERQVCWESLPVELAIDRISRWVTVLGWDGDPRPLVTVTRTITDNDAYTDDYTSVVGNALHFAMAAGDGNYYTWSEDVDTADYYVGAGPGITDQIFRLAWPTITGTAYGGTSMSAQIRCDEVSLGFRNVGGGGGIYGPPTLNINDAQGFRPDLPYDPATQDWVRIQQTATTTTIFLGPDGTTWTEVATNDRMDDDYGEGVTNIEWFIVGMSFDSWSGTDPPDPVTGIIDSWSPQVRPFGTTTYTVGSRFDPDADWPAETEPGCATVLDQIRAFSGKVKRAIRVTGVNTISMVSDDEPLPAGLSTATDAAEAYHSQSQQLTAGPVVLSQRAGDLVLDVGASLVSDDVRLPASGFRAPGRLPLINGLDPAPVKRVSYSFTPQGFTGTVEFHVRDVPLTLRRTN